MFLLNLGLLLNKSYFFVARGKALLLSLLLKIGLCVERKKQGSIIYFFLVILPPFFGLTL